MDGKRKQPIVLIVTITLGRLGSRNRMKGGFSLVEVVLAMGIFAFCLICMLGLMTLGLMNLHQSNQIFSSSRIGEQVLVDLEQSTFADLTSGAPPTTYYDGDGNPLPNSTNAVYQATYSVSTPAQLPDGLPSANLAKVTVKVGRYGSQLNSASFIGYIAQ